LEETTSDGEKGTSLTVNMNGEPSCTKLVPRHRSIKTADFFMAVSKDFASIMSSNSFRMAVSSTEPPRTRRKAFSACCSFPLLRSPIIVRLNN
jgi:hypothetical protein